MGHPPDLLDHQAITALIEHAGGSGVRLRAALAATLFLASTEDAPRIGRTLVARALQESGDIPAAPPVVPRRWKRVLVPAACLAAGAALGLAVLVYRPSSPEASKPAHTTLAQAVPVPPQGLAAEAERQPPPDAQATLPQTLPAPPAVTQAPAPAQPAAPAPLSAAPEPVAPEPAAPKPAAASSAPPIPPDLPAGPPTRVVLMVSSQGQATAQKLDSLTKHLHAAGIGEVETQSSSSAHARRPVSYFFADDLPVAERITQILAVEDWPRLARNALTPRLVVPPAGLPSRQPGLIEIQLP